MIPAPARPAPKRASVYCRCPPPARSAVRVRTPRRRVNFARPKSSTLGSASRVASPAPPPLVFRVFDFMTFDCEEDVPRLQVAVDDAPEVRGVNGPGEPLDEFCRGPRRRPPRAGRWCCAPCAACGPKRSALEQFHRQVRDRHPVRPQVGVHLEHLHHLRVLDAGKYLGLGHEPLHDARIGGSAGEDHLQCDQPVQPPVPGLVHHPHPAATDLGGHLERPGTVGNPACAVGGNGCRNALDLRVRVRRPGDAGAARPAARSASAPCTGRRRARLFGEAVQSLLAQRAAVHVTGHGFQPLGPGATSFREPGQFGIVQGSPGMGKVLMDFAPSGRREIAVVFRPNGASCFFRFTDPVGPSGL